MPVFVGRGVVFESSGECGRARSIIPAGENPVPAR